MSKPKGKAVVIGGSNIDLKGYPEGNYLPRTSNPGEVIERLGGVARNIAENLGLLGVPTSLLAAVGDDHYGNELVQKTDKDALDLSRVIRSSRHGTGRYLVLHDETGEMVGAISDMEVMSEVTPTYLERNRSLIERSEILALDANPGRQTLEKLFSILQGRADTTVVADPVSVDKAVKLRDHLDQVDIITPNEDEVRALFGLEDLQTNDLEPLAGKVQGSLRTLDLGLSVVVTSGDDGLALVTGKTVRRFNPVPVPNEEIKDTTGAGDTLTAAMIYALLGGNSMLAGLDLGTAAASEAIKSRRTVNLDLKSALEA